MKIAEQIASSEDEYELYCSVNEDDLCVYALYANWKGFKYSKYYFKDDSLLIKCGTRMYALAEYSGQKRQDFANWLHSHTDIKQAYIHQLLMDFVYGKEVNI